MPARISPMYVPDVFATTEVQKVDVSPGTTGNTAANATRQPGAEVAASEAGAGTAAAAKGGVQ
jgi:hypothetical protein